ncbi:MAG: ArsR/SmtB family transcription factor [Candidatus Aminicenantales bacterium]
MKEAIEIFKALSDPTRLRILMLLLRQDLCVGELIFILKMEQSRISHQLRFLKSAGLVEDTRDGRWIIYSIPERIKKTLSAIFEEFLGGDLKKSPEIKKDLRNLERCISKNIRKVKKTLEIKNVKKNCS